MSVALPPVDDTVTIPPSVKRAAEAADAIHAQAYPTPQPDPPPTPKPTVLNEDVGHEDDLAPAPLTPPPAPLEPPQPHDPTVTPTRDDLRESEWARRYNSMKGRYDVSQQTMGSMQEQLSELGDELIRTQQALQLARRGEAPDPHAPPQPPRRQVNEDDVKTYGSELIEFVQRAARDAVAPDLEQVTSQVRQTNQKVTQTAQGTLYAQLDADVPTWKTINVDPRFKNWCRLRDVYSGQVRGKLLNAAFQAADAPRVVAFFQGFLSEEQATGQMPAPQPEPPVPQAPRQAAIPLDTLAAPGRAKPAGGDGPASAADKPVFTRAQIATFYSDVRKGVYNGRDADKLATEQQIFAAQREGRVR